MDPAPDSTAAGQTPAARASDPAATPKLRRWGFLFILALFLVLATYYNITNPLFEAPDELEHAAYVVYLADARSLPVIDPEQVGPLGQEAAQSPLYYWLAATLLSPFPHRPADSLAETNPHANIGEPLRPDNKNRVLHDMEQEQWPYQGEILYFHLARLFSTALALGTLWAIYRLGQTAFPGRPGIPLAMMASVAFTPQFLFLSSSVSNDSLVILISSWTLVGLAAWLRRDQLPSWRQVGAVGVGLSLAVLAKTSGLLLWPLAAGVLIWVAWRARNMRWLVAAGLLCFGIALAVSGWWFLRNQRLYGDLTASRPLAAVLGGPRQDLPTHVRGILAEFRGFRYSLWALFGWFNILAPQAFYWILDVLTAVGILGFGVFVARSLSRYPRSTLYIVVMLLGWLGLVAAGVLWWTVLISSQGRLAFPALGAAALILVVGWAEILPRRLYRTVGPAGLAVWAVWAALCPALIIRPAYAIPERMESLAEVAPDLSYLRVRYADCCELVGYIPPDQPAHQGDWVPVILVWRVLAPTDRDYSLFVHARTPEATLAGQLDTYPGNGMYPTSQWRPGEIIADTLAVPLSWEVEPPSLLRFQVGLYDLATMRNVPSRSAEGAPVEVVVAGEIALVPAEWPPSLPDSATSAIFGQRIGVSVIELPRQPAPPGSLLTVTLQWQAYAPISEDYTGFVHLVDAGGHLVSQDDHPPRQGSFPTRLWQEGTVLEDVFRLALPATLDDGSYELLAGLYRPESGERLPAISPGTGQRWQDDLVRLGSVVIDREGH